MYAYMLGKKLFSNSTCVTEDFCTCNITKVYYCAFGFSRGKSADMTVISIPVSWFHGLLWSNRGGAAAKVIRRRNDSLSAIPGYYGRNQFFRDDSLPGTSRRPSAVSQEWAFSPLSPSRASVPINIYLLIEFIKVVTIRGNVTDLQRDERCSIFSTNFLYSAA